MSKFTIEERFWAKVRKTEGCWEWTAYRNHKGYGRIMIDQYPYSAHRVSYEWNVGPIPQGMIICHRCDNPPCVRPDHLFVGTYLDNSKDAASKGRLQTGEKNPQAVLTEADVLEIRSSYIPRKVTHAKLAAIYGVSPTTIGRILAGDNWKHVAMPNGRAA